VDRRQRILNSEVGMRNAERLEFGSGNAERPEFGSWNAECGKKAKGMGHSVKEIGPWTENRGY
jgi:hypothetical protein